MLYRYNLLVSLKEQEVFNGNFSSINKLVKVASCFNQSCKFDCYDTLFGKIIPVESLIDEFETQCTGI